MGHIGTQELIWEKTGVIDPNEYDLLHFHWRQWSEHEDGHSVCSDGWTHHRLYYRDDHVVAISILRVGDIETERKVEGETRLLDLERVGIRLGHVMRILRHLGGGETKPNFSPAVVISDLEHAVLIRHPQYQRLLQGWKMRGFLAFLERDNDIVHIVRLVKIEH